MQVAYDFRAVKSPCLSCSGKKQPHYPDCRETCRPVNDFLIFLGDLPHVPSENKSVHWRQDYVPVGLATHEQFLQAKSRIFRWLDELQISPGNLSTRIGTNNMVIYKLVRGQSKRISLENYRKIMGWKAE